MKITDELIRHIENLAKLKLKSEEMYTLRKDMENILGYVKLISEVDVSGYEAMRGPFEENMVPRKDEIRDFEASKILREAPSLQGDLIKVSSIHGK